MKIFFCFILIFISPIFNYNIPKSFYSLLLGKIREDIVDSALLNLPKRTSIDILKMSLLIVDEKEKNSLTDSESAFLIYKWIAQNIEINCYYSIKNEESESTVYKSGKGRPSAISSLFNKMCSYMNIKSDSISGYYKTLNNSEYYKKFSEAEHTWNYILIDNQTYLIDPSLGIGYCNNYYYTKSYSDFYFGTKPDILIKSHFPNDVNFQLLNKNITRSQWSSFVFIRPFFYLNSFKSISPESENINIKNDKKIIINYEAEKKEIGIVDVTMNFVNGGKIYISNINYLNGRIEISLDKWYKVDGSNPMRIEIYSLTKDNPDGNLVTSYYIIEW